MAYWCDDYHLLLDQRRRDERQAAAARAMESLGKSGDYYPRRLRDRSPL